MTSLLRLQPRLLAPSSVAYISRPIVNLPAQRCYTQGSAQKGRDKDASKQERPASRESPDNPIPSNKAQPTLSHGKQTPVADHEGNLRDDLPADVKKHNEEVEQRYDRPFHQITDEGEVKTAWKEK